MGLEPTIFRFEVGRLIRWATRPTFVICFIHFLKYHIKLGSGSITSTIRVLHGLLGKFCILGKLDGSTEQIRTCHIMKLGNTNIYINKLHSNKLKSVNRSEIKKIFMLRSSKTKNRSKGHCCTQTFFRTVESVRAPRYWAHFLKQNL